MRHWLYTSCLKETDYQPQSYLCWMRKNLAVGVAALVGIATVKLVPLKLIGGTGLMFVNPSFTGAARLVEL